MHDQLKYRRGFFGPLDRLKEARALPLGHYELAEAKAAVDREYQHSRELEVSFIKKLRRRWKGPWYLTAQQAANICGILCSYMGLKKSIKMVWVFSKEVMLEAAAHYNPKTKEIHSRYGGITLGVLLHELAHHVAITEFGVDGHGEGFVWAERYVLEAFMESGITEI